MPDVNSSTCGKIFPVAICGGDDVDGACRSSLGPLRSVPMARVVTGISFLLLSLYVLNLQISGPLTLVYGILPIIGALLP